MSFASFLRHYHSVPPEKLDGYAPSDFADMSEEERAGARAMMTERGLRGDTIDLDGLRYVGNEETVAALAVGERAGEQDYMFDVVRLETLYVLTRDGRFAARLLTWTDGPDAAARRFAADTLTRHALPPDMAGAIVARLADGRHEELIRQLVSAWLGTRGEPIGGNIPALQRHLPLIHAVRATAPEERPALLAAES